MLYQEDDTSQFHPVGNSWAAWTGDAEQEATSDATSVVTRPIPGSATAVCRTRQLRLAILEMVTINPGDLDSEIIARMLGIPFAFVDDVVTEMCEEGLLAPDA